MFRTLTTVCLSLAFAAPIAAQKMGGANRNAPTCMQGIEFKSGGSLQVHYTAITFGEGAWAKSDGMRARIREAASQSPLGKVVVTGTVMLGGKKVPEGTYKLYFTPGEEKGSWVMHCDAAEGEAKVHWNLPMQKAEAMTSRLAIVVTPGEAANEAGVSLSFGKMMAKVGASPVKKEG